MRKVLLLGICFSAFLFLLDLRSAYAIPAFARRDGVACQQCHFRMPELKEDGNDYLRRGLREAPLPADSGKTAPVAANNWPLGVPLPLQWTNYLSIMGEHSVNWSRGAKTEFSAGGLDLWAGGPFDPHWSALVDASFDIQAGGNSVDVGYAQFITNWGDKFGSVRFGQTHPFAVQFHQGGPSLPLSMPLVFSTPAATGTQTGWTATTPIDGAEAGYVNLRNWNLYLGVGQPNTGNPAGVAGSHTDVYGSADYFFGKGGNQVSLFSYMGEARIGLNGEERPFNRFGVLSNIYWPRTKASLGYVTGKDDDVDGTSLDNSGFFVQGEQLLNDRWSVYGRYDYFKQDVSNVLGGGEVKMQGPALGVAWWPVTPFKVALEGQLLNTTGQDQARSLTLDFLWIF